MIVVLDNIRSAQNVGSILRTCDAFGVKEVVLCGITPGLENPKVMKTSLGAEHNITINAASSTLKMVRDLKAKGTRIIALELTDNAKPLAKESTNNIALIVGNEVSGVSNEVLELCEETILIPMCGVKESLNVAVAFGIAAYILTS